MTLLICDHCKQEFRRRGKARYAHAYCGNGCRYASRIGIAPYEQEGTQIPFTKLRTEALRGDTCHELAKALGVATTTALKLLRRAGLHDTWKEQRAI